jgi:hypothetical protein
MFHPIGIFVGTSEMSAAGSNGVTFNRAFFATYNVEQWHDTDNGQMDDHVNNYQESKATYWDTYFNTGIANGIYCVWVCNDQTRWATTENPYVVDGVITDSTAGWTSTTLREVYKRTIRWRMARYGYNTCLVGFDLINETGGGTAAAPFHTDVSSYAVGLTGSTPTSWPVTSNNMEEQPHHSSGDQTSSDYRTRAIDWGDDNIGMTHYHDYGRVRSDGTYHRWTSLSSDVGTWETMGSTLLAPWIDASVWADRTARIVRKTAIAGGGGGSSLPRLSNGWYLPTARTWSDGTVDPNWSYSVTNPKQPPNDTSPGGRIYGFMEPGYTSGYDHVGTDIRQVQEEPCYAICDGVIERMWKQIPDDPTYWTIIVEHRLSNDTIFWGIYGHNELLSSLSVGSPVVGGQQIGTCKENPNWHCHFGINVNPSLMSGFGRIPDGDNPSDYGWTAPRTYMITHTPKIAAGSGSSGFTKPMAWSEYGLIYINGTVWDDWTDAKAGGTGTGAYNGDTGGQHAKDWFWTLAMTGISGIHWHRQYFLGDYGGGTKWWVCKPLYNFLNGVDFRGMNQQTTYSVADDINPSPTLICSQPTKIQVVGFTSSTKAYLHVKNLTNTWYRQAGSPRASQSGLTTPSPVSQTATVTLKGMSGGTYTIDKYSTTDTNAGTQIKGTSSVTIGAGQDLSFSVSVGDTTDYDWGYKVYSASAAGNVEIYPGTGVASGLTTTPVLSASNVGIVVTRGAATATTTTPTISGATTGDTTILSSTGSAWGITTSPTMALSSALVTAEVGNAACERVHPYLPILVTENVYGYDNFIAIDVEDTEGVPVEGTLYLDLLGSSFAQRPETNFKSSLRSGRALKTAIPKPGTIAGDINFELPVSQSGMIFYALCGDPVTTGSGPYTHVFTNPVLSTACKTLTVVQRWGGYYRLATGAIIGNIVLRAALDNPLTATVSLSALDMCYEDRNSNANSTWLSSPEYDVSGSFEDYHVGMYIDNTFVDTIDDVTITINTGVVDKRNIGGGRLSTKHLPGQIITTVNYNMYFSTDKERYQLLGHLSPPTTPYKIADTAAPSSSMKLEAIKDTFSFSVEVPDMRIVDIGDAEYMEDIIKVPVVFQAMYYEPEDTDVIITLVNNVDVIVTGTSIDGAYLPSGFGRTSLQGLQATVEEGAGEV